MFAAYRLAWIGIAATAFAVVGCSSPGATPAEGRATCDNAIVDGPESDVDCGGTCDRCAAGRICHNGADCVSGACEGGFCLADAPTCTDQRQNGTETAIDCGGTCPGCAADQPCLAPTDCRSGVCTNHLCDESAACGDALLSPGESDVDCGGPCSPCATGLKCKGSIDCLSITCTFGICRDPTCTDTVLNQGESDTDCGGPCGPCVDGNRCAVPDDCASTHCAGNLCVSCEDEIRNGEESDKDCGGSYCAACGDGHLCGKAGDCSSGRCADGHCSSCTDQVKNGAETGVDCGGGCPACADGIACGGVADCVSGRCTEASGVKTCTSCSDGKTNGGETDRDCGGPCGPCALGGHCGDKDDCAAGICENQACCTPNKCGFCGTAPAEVCNGKDDDCDSATDEAAEIGQPPLCTEQDGVCAGTRTVCRGTAGWTCQASDFTAHNAQYQGSETTCDALDNDCDGTTDQGLKNACNQCGALPTEVCNAKDDDCDGSTDEGVKNACGLCGQVPVEICNGKDDDCDGKTDEWAGCAECVANPTRSLVVNGWAHDTAYDFNTGPDTLAASGADAWFLPGTMGTRAFHLYGQGQVAPVTLPRTFVASPAVAGDGGTFGVAGFEDDGTSYAPFLLVLCKPDGTGCKVESEQFFFNANSAAVRLVAHAGNWHILAEAYDGGPTLKYMAFANGAFSAPDTISQGDVIYAFDLAVDGHGQPIIMWTDDQANIRVRVGTGATNTFGNLGGDYFTVAGTSDGRALVFASDIGNAGHWFSNAGLGTAFTAMSPAPPFRYGGGALVSLDPQDRAVLGDISYVDTPNGAVIDSANLIWQSVTNGATTWNTFEVTRWETYLQRDPVQIRTVADGLGRIRAVLELETYQVQGFDYDQILLCPGFVSCGATCGTEPNPDGTTIIPGPNPDPPSGITINELLYDTVGADGDVWVEIKGPPGTSLVGWTLVGVNGDGGASYKTVALTGAIPASGYYLVVDSGASAGLKATAQLVASCDFQNGPDSVQLKNGAAIVDAVAYGTFGAGMTAAGEGSPEPGPAANAGSSIARSPDGADTNQNASDFTIDTTPTPGAANGP